MTLRQKNEIIAEVAALLEKKLIVDEDTAITHTINKPIEMLTIKKCT